MLLHSLLLIVQEKFKHGVYSVIAIGYITKYTATSDILIQRSSHNVKDKA